MKISIEFKNGKFTVSYGAIQGVGNTPHEAIDALVEAFRTQMQRFFVK